MNRKGLINALVGIAALSMTGCKMNGIEKEYTMDIKEAPVQAVLKSDTETEVTVIHCTRGMSLYNYYIRLPEPVGDDFILPMHLAAKDTANDQKYIITVDGKEKTVSDYGYVFLNWGELAKGEE